MPRLALEYPNGRTHELDYNGPFRCHAGDEFELYGRRWRVVGRRLPPRNARMGAVPVIVCTSLVTETRVGIREGSAELR